MAHRLVRLGGIDEGTCRFMHDFFRVGTIVRSKRRKDHYDDECAYRVQSVGDLVNVIVPFMDEHLPASYKRRQYLEWRGNLLRYWDAHAKRTRPCSIEACDAPQRAKGLCRHHYYLEYGR